MKSILLVAMLVVSSMSMAELQLIFPSHQDAQDARERYALNVIQTIVDHSDQLSLQTSTFSMNRARMERELALGDRINILLLPERLDYNDLFAKVPVAIDGGLVGQRVALVAQGSKALEQVETLDDLRQLKGCTGESWTVTRWYDANQLKTVKLATYDHLFIYTERGACDYFSRSVLEVEQEFKQQQERGRALVIDPHLLLQIPINQYLYLSPNQPELLDAVIDAAQAAKESGALQRVLSQYTDSLFEIIELDDRLTIQLPVAP